LKNRICLLIVGLIFGLGLVTWASVPSEKENLTTSQSWIQRLLDRERAISEGVKLPRLRIPWSLAEWLKFWSKSAPDEKGNPLLSAEQLVQDPGFLSSAEVEFDAGKEVWTARWSKPRMFNFGMLLKPELLKRVQVGKPLSFEHNGETASLSKSENNELMMVSHTGEKTTLGARDILHLLENKIETGGLSLFVEPCGDLVMEARGEQAQLLAKARN
jgi:hypothetical protein